MTKPVLSELNVFPIKSLGGIKVKRWELSDRGLCLDRRWMLIDPDGRFISQREYPSMAMLHVEVQFHGDTGGHDITGTVDSIKDLFVTDARDPSASLKVSLNPEVESTTPVTIWESTCQAQVYSDPVNRWFSERIGVDCRLVFMPDDTRRPVDPDYQLPTNSGTENNSDTTTEIVGFADGFPFLIVGQASLVQLNARLEISGKPTVSMDRFRTNMVFSGCKPFAEDSWTRIRIGEVEFRVVKPCARCVMTTVDPETGKRGLEPLRTLATYRRAESGGVMFGQNLIQVNAGILEVGTPIEVLERNA